MLTLNKCFLLSLFFSPLISSKEQELLNHLAAFHLPFYFDDVYVSFIIRERNSAKTFVLLMALHTSKYVKIVKLATYEPNRIQKIYFTTYMVTDSGRQEALKLK